MKMGLNYFIVVLLLHCCCYFTLTDTAPEIQFSFGRVQGQDERAEDTRRPFSAYYGIPFATPPVGNLRFRPPQPYVNNDPNKVISSGRFRPSCIQVPEFAPEMDEDCLHLNVFVPPRAAPGQLKKVMVYIHGGAYVLGSAKEALSSRIVTDYDVIVVSIQYRLGVLGFLSTADDVQPGNNGYLDQIMALQWVKDNIRQFGGDDGDITIFGESAGAGSVSVLSISPLTKGLFTKGIMQSGTTLAPWGLVREPKELTYKLAKSAGCLPFFYVPGFLSSYHENMVQCLREKPIDLINASPSFIGSSKKPVVDLDLTHYIEFSPVVDGIVLPKHPKYLLEDKNYLREVGALDRQYIIGVTNNEGLTMLDSLIFAIPGATLKNYTDPYNARDLIRSTTQTVLPVPPSPEMLDTISYVYTYPRKLNGEIPLDKTLDLTTDTNFVVPSVVFARALLQASPALNIYFYLFDHYPELKDPTSVTMGSNHGMDLIYLFDRQSDWDIIAFYALINTPADQPLYGIFRGALTSFAKTGNPSVPGGPVWPRYERDNEFYMAISTSPKVKQHLYSRRVALWTEFIPKMIKNGFQGRSGKPDFTL